MKIRNRQLVPPKPVVVTIYRENDDGTPDNIDFICGAVLDYGEFDKLCPTPKPPLVTKLSTGEQSYDNQDKRFKQAVEKWSGMKIDWMILQSLRHTEGIEWDTVKYNDPETWGNHEAELKTFLTENEVNRVVQGVISANSPTQNRRKEALDSFTPTQEAAEPLDSTSQQDEPISTPSTEPASV